MDFFEVFHMVVFYAVPTLIEAFYMKMSDGAYIDPDINGILHSLLIS